MNNGIDAPIFTNATYVKDKTDVNIALQGTQFSINTLNITSFTTASTRKPMVLVRQVNVNNALNIINAATAAVTACNVNPDQTFGYSQLHVRAQSNAIVASSSAYNGDMLVSISDTQTNTFSTVSNCNFKTLTCDFANGVINNGAGSNSIVYTGSNLFYGKLKFTLLGTKTNAGNFTEIDVVTGTPIAYQTVTETLVEAEIKNSAAPPSAVVPQVHVMLGKPGIAVTTPIRFSVDATYPVAK